jgi:hypothetical protein
MRHDDSDSCAAETACAAHHEKYLARVKLSRSGRCRVQKRSIGRMSKTGQRPEAKIFQNFVVRVHPPSDQRPKLQITRCFPCGLAVNTPFMLALLELNTSYNHLCDSILRHPRNCIDARWQTSKIELPKPHHVVSVRALDTIGCGSWRSQTSLFRVSGSRSPKSGAPCRIDPFPVDPIACVQAFTLVLVGCPVTLRLGKGCHDGHSKH